MVPQIDKILFTTDLSEESRRAFEYAISLADRYGARITILYVMEEFSKSANAYIKSFVGDDRWKEIQEDHEREARQILIGKQKEGVLIKDALNQFCEEAQKDYSQCSYVVDDIVVTKGNVVDEILSQAQAGHCDVIVMGYRVKGKFEEAMLGSTTRPLLRRSKIPVMLVRL